MKTALILSGPTHEYLDPVRFLGNASSGKMGKALAEEALLRGFNVQFISGPVARENLPILPNPILQVTGAEEMRSVADAHFPTADLIIFAAAVSDFQPAEKLDKKFPKVDRTISLELKPTPDIAATLCKRKRADQIAVGFALQTHDGEQNAHRKLVEKNLDGIVLNTPATLGAESGLFTWIDSQSVDNWGSLSKAECAKKIFDQALA
jgi:phosphopantothenoylcysteine decarboxylase/phosphopantothenate--cysteine ligase